MDVAETLWQPPAHQVPLGMLTCLGLPGGVQGPGCAWRAPVTVSGCALGALHSVGKTGEDFGGADGMADAGGHPQAMAVLPGSDNSLPQPRWAAEDGVKASAGGVCTLWDALGWLGGFRLRLLLLASGSSQVVGACGSFLSLLFVLELPAREAMTGLSEAFSLPTHQPRKLP